MPRLDGRRVLLVVSGGIAAYKSAILVRRLRQAGSEIDVVMTASAEKMVGAATFQALSGRTVYTSLWSAPLAHIELGKEADLAVVAPATANILARMANGLADDMATSTLLAAACPILVCPAMNTRMWDHPATRENVAKLRERGVHVLGPSEGELAEGEVGPGRMIEPEIVVDFVSRLLHAPSRLSGRKVVVTAGPTRAPLDPVRYLGNRSSGRMGFELAAEAWRRGAEVVLIAGPTSVPPPFGPRLIRVEASEEMGEALEAEIESSSVLIMAAAVADFRAVEPQATKIKRQEGVVPSLGLEHGPDLLRDTLRLRERAGVFTLGFALETEDGVANAEKKLQSKGLDLIALNEAGRKGSGFDAESNQVTLIDCSGVVEEMPLLSKAEVAVRLLDHVEERLA